jgi:hypothetical protein
LPFGVEPVLLHLLMNRPNDWLLTSLQLEVGPLFLRQIAASHFNLAADYAALFNHE